MCVARSEQVKLTTEAQRKLMHPQYDVPPQAGATPGTGDAYSVDVRLIVFF